MDKFLSQVKESAVQPAAAFIKDKAGTIGSATLIILISTFFSTILSWSLTYHTITDSMKQQQFLAIQRQINMSESLATAIKKLQDTQQQVGARVGTMETSMKMFVSKTYVNTKYRVVNNKADNINDTVYASKRLLSDISTQFNVYKTQQAEYNINSTAELKRMMEDDQKSSAALNKVVTKVKELKTRGEEVGQKQEIIGTEMATIVSNMSAITNKLDQTRASLLNLTDMVNTLEASLDDYKKGSALLRNISENLAIAAALIDNSSAINIPANTVAALRLELVEQVTAEAKFAIDGVKNSMEAKVQEITNRAKTETSGIKADLEKFKSKYQTDQFKNLGYIEIGDAGFFRVSSSSETWAAAQRDCNAKLGYLVEFSNKEEQSLVVTTLQDNNDRLDVFWLGGRDTDKEGTFIWEHSKKNMNQGFSSWGEGEPNDYSHGEDCIEFTEGKWNDIACDEERHYICKYNSENKI